MSDDYLWDRSGTPDVDVLFLERMLPRVREQVRQASASEVFPAELPRVEAPRRMLPLAAVGIAAGIVLVFGAWRVAQPTRVPAATSIRGEPPNAPAATTPPAPNAPLPELDRATAPPPPAPRLAPPAPVVKGIPPLVGSAEPEAAPPEPMMRSHVEIQTVVARHRNEVRERCWEPALAKRKEGAASTVKLSVTFTIQANGRVASVKAGASPPDYPSLAGCVGAEVRTWAFGPAEDSTVVAVPFVFAEAR